MSNNPRSHCASVSLFWRLRSMILVLGVIGLSAGARAQVADNLTGASVALKFYNLTWDQSPDSAPQFYAQITDMNGTQSTNTALYPDASTNQIMARLVVGKTYSLGMYSVGVTAVTLLAVPPPGFVMEMDGIAREQMVFGNPESSVTLRIRPQTADEAQRAGTASSLGTDRVLWQVSLGDLSNGDSAGALAFIDTGAGSDISTIFSPTGLAYDPPTSEVQIVYNPQNATAPYIPGTIRQIIAPQLCVDVFMDSSSQCELKCYHRAQIGTADSNGVYSFTGDPYAWYFFNQTGSQANSVTISCDIRNITGTDSNTHLPILLPSGQPVVRSKVTTLVRSGTAPNYTWTADAWYDNQAGSSSLSETTRSRTGSSETTSIAVPSGTAILNTQRAYTAEPWGEEVTTESAGTTNPITNVADPISTDYAFEGTSDTQSAEYTRLLSKTTNGRYEAYEYYDYADGVANAGRLKTLHRPFDATSTSAPSDLSADNQEVTSYTYTVDAYGRGTRPVDVITTVAGVQISKSHTSYADAVSGFTGHAALNIVTATRTDTGPNNTSLSTTTKYFQETAGDPTFNPPVTDDFFRFKIHSVCRPNGTQNSFVYQRGTWDGTAFSPSGNGGVDAVPGSFASRICVISGTWKQPSGATAYSSCYGYPIDPIYLVVDQSDPSVTKYKSTMNVTIRDTYARVVRSEVYLWTGGDWQLIKAQNYEWNFSNQPIARATNLSTDWDMTSGTLYSATYNGERLTTETKEDGSVFDYSYDSLDRIDTATREAGAGIGALVTKYDYDAASHVTGVHNGWGQSDQVITITQHYDDAGRLYQVDNPGPNGVLTTKYDYNPNSRQVTVMFPDGGTKAVQYQPNGDIESVSGTAVVPTYYTRDIAADGTEHTKVCFGSSGSGRYVESWRDSLGRVQKISHPGFTGQPAFVDKLTYDGGTGLLSIDSRQDATGGQLYGDLVYRYDSLGQAVADGLDLSNNDTLEAASTDRIQNHEKYFEKWNGDWWLTSAGAVYPVDNSATALPIATTRARLTGMGSGVVSEISTTDADGNVTDVQTTINRAAKTVTETTTKTGYGTATSTHSNGFLTSETGFDGITVTTQYDSMCREYTVTDARTGAETIYYDPHSAYISKIQNAKGDYIHMYGYDSAGRVNSDTDAAGYQTYTGYDLRGQVVRRWGGGATPYEVTYDVYGDQSALRTFHGTSVDFTSATWPLNDSGLDSSGDPTATAWTVGDKTTWSYDPPSGLLVSKTDAANHAVSYGYNSRGQVVTKTLPVGKTLTFHYYGDADDSTTTRTGELREVSYSDVTPTVQYAYTRLGQLNQVTDATGVRTINYVPANALRRDSTTLSSYFGARVITEQYDTVCRAAGFKIGDPTRGAGADVSQTYNYDGAGRFDHLDGTNGADTSRTFAYSYTPNSELIAGYTVGSLSVSRTYEPKRDLLSSIDSQWSSTSRTRYDYVNNSLGQRYTAKQSGDVFSGDYGQSTYRRFTYDGRGELTTAADYFGDTPMPLDADPSQYTSYQLPSRNFAFGYDNVGNRTTSSRNGPSAGQSSYPFDSTHAPLNQYSTRSQNYFRASGTVSSQTTSVAVSGGSLAWGTGKNGRFWAADALLDPSASPQFVSATITATIANSGGNDVVRTQASPARRTPPGTQTFQYDADGNLSDDGMWSYSYDAEDRLTSMETEPALIAGIADPNARRLEFVYDYANRRVQKLVRGGWDGTSYTTVTSQRRYIYYGSRLILEVSGDGATIDRSYTWGLSTAGALDDVAGALLEITDWNSGKSYYPTYDGNGNVAALLNVSSGAAAIAYEYSPFGVVLHAGASNWNTPVDPSIADNPFQFGTNFTDVETGLVYYGERYYSPALGRFINRDPIEEAGGINLYGFCGNDPVDNTDMLGCGETDQMGTVVVSAPRMHPGLGAGLYTAGVDFEAGVESHSSIIKMIGAPTAYDVSSGRVVIRSPGMRIQDMLSNQVYWDPDVGCYYIDGQPCDAVTGSDGGTMYRPMSTEYMSQFVVNGSRMKEQAPHISDTIAGILSTTREALQAAAHGGLTYARGVAEGSLKAVIGTGRTILHPIVTLEDLGYSAGTLVGNLTFYPTETLRTIELSAFDTVMDPSRLGNSVGRFVTGAVIGGAASDALRIDVAAETGAAPVTETQLEFAFARGAAVQTPGVTLEGETFVRVGARPVNLKFGLTEGGVQPGTYAFPEATFNAIGEDPVLLKNFGDLPDPNLPQYYRILRPPAGTSIQRGIVPGGENGGVGGAEEVIFTDGF